MIVNNTDTTMLRKLSRHQYAKSNILEIKIFYYATMKSKKFPAESRYLLSPITLDQNDFPNGYYSYFANEKSVLVQPQHTLASVVFLMVALK